MNFDTWKTPEPSADFADRVTNRLFAQQDRTRRGRRLAIAAVAASALLLATWLLRTMPQEGTHTADARTTLALGDRAAIVAEPHTSLSWRVERSGRTIVQHDRGAAFYRVDQGEAFTVNTPYGSIDVRGTCFSVEVSEMGAKTAAVSAVLSAAVTGAVFVTVYEGRVALGSNGGEPIAIDAGERAYATPGQAAKKIAQTSTQRPSEAAPQNAAVAPEPVRDLAAAQTKIATLESALAQTRSEVESLRAAQAKSAAPNDPAAAFKHQQSFRPGPEELAQMAKRCEVRIDMPPGMFQREPPSVGKRWRENYNLNDDEARAVKKAMQAMHADVQKNVRELYILVTGDGEAAKWLSPQAMFEELEDKTAEEIQALARQRISAERAGLQPPPTDAAGFSPGERYMRWFTGLSDAFEAKLAKELGPERARAMHDKFEGWPGARWSMNGCPGE
ncbi:MAG: FecR domain-containing protein [Deltaproteobacteria bacterium]|nr:FecR domain-containing protein [Deltaproteobacteria bacterium]